MDILVRLLAVVGGAAAGATGIGLLLRFAGKLVGAKSAPRRPVLVLRGLAGLAGGWVAWLLVFGTGGFGIGGPGGFGRGGGQNAGVEGSASNTQLASVTSPVEPRKSLAILMLGGGRVKQERFYLPVGDSTPKTLSELKELIRQRQKNGVNEIEIMVYDNSVAKDHAAVAALEEWSKQNQMSVKLTFSPGEAP